MLETEYSRLIDQFPTYISLPCIDRPHRPMRTTLAGVIEKADLPGRLLFGDLVDDSFRKDPSGWSVAYRDGFGNGIDLVVRGEQFRATPFFLGKNSFSLGPATRKEAFLQLIGLAGDHWALALKEHLEARYPVNVAEPLEHQPSACYLPDGWLRTLLIPVPEERLGDVLRFHLALADDPLLGAPQMGSLALQPQVINYVEGRAPEGCDEPSSLILRHLLSCNTPLLCEPVREEGNDGTAAWTLRRLAYLYRCSCFLRDVPHVMEKLFAAGLLSPEPDLCSSILPAELAYAADHVSWWSAKRACRSTWTGFEKERASIGAGIQATAGEAGELVRRAQKAAAAHATFFGLT